MTARPRLAGFVHVGGVAYGPDDDVPDEVAKQITNPKAWVGDTLPAPEGDKAPAPAAGGDTLPVPPRSGPGSGATAWAAFAAANGVPVEDGAGRDAIIAALTRAGVLQEG